MCSRILFPQRPIQVLVADHDSDNRWLCTSLLQRAGHGSVTAEDGQQALALLAEYDVDLLLLSIALPPFGGLAILAQLRSAESTALSGRRQRVILVTGPSSPGDLAWLRAAGADGCIARPIDPVCFDHEIARVLGVTTA